MNDDDGKIGNVRDLDAGTSLARSRPIDTQAQPRAPHAQRGQKTPSLYVRFAPTAAIVDALQRSAALVSADRIDGSGKDNRYGTGPFL
jgi:hypothetical protein